MPMTLNRMLISATLLLSLVGCGESRRTAGELMALDSSESNLTARIEGPGYFIFKTSAGGFLFSKRGAFFVGADGDLVNADGYPVIPRINGAPGTGQLDILPGGQVQAITSDTRQRLEIGQLRIAVFPEGIALEQDGDYVFPTDELAKPTLTSPGQRGAGVLRISGKNDER